MEKIIKEMDPPFGEDRTCEICGLKIKVGIDKYYFVRDENKEGKIVCLECKNKLYLNNN
jgi:hypothetical protein